MRVTSNEGLVSDSTESSTKAQNKKVVSRVECFMIDDAVKNACNSVLVETAVFNNLSLVNIIISGFLVDHHISE